jgi:hypothetical protein
MLEQELEPLNAQIEQARQKRKALEGELRAVEAEIETFSTDKQRYDALRDVCDALDKLVELKANELFWEGIPEAKDAVGHLERVRGRVVRFEGEIRGILEKQASLQEQINQCLDELYILDEEVRNAHDREEKRKEEFVIEREISPVPYRAMIMPWSKEAESENRFHRAVLVALLICFVFISLIPQIIVPIPDPSVDVVKIPERLVKLVKKEPIPRPRPEQQKPDKPAKGKEPAPEPSKIAADKVQKAATARKKAERAGVLAFKGAFVDLLDETPLAKLGAEARLSDESPRVAGRARARRSLVAMQAKSGSSGGIGNSRISRNVGSGNVDRLGGAGIGKGFARVESTIGGLGESSRPLSDGVAPGRTDEEIQIVFDRYKAALYRIYNKELRKDPTLRGKILLRISIETSGAVSMCKVESTDLASPELVSKIVERIKRFNFGPKEGVQKLTILYPIDFLPSG